MTIAKLRDSNLKSCCLEAAVDLTKLVKIDQTETSLIGSSLNFNLSLNSSVLLYSTGPDLWDSIWNNVTPKLDSGELHTVPTV